MKNERATLIWAAAGAIFLAVLIYCRTPVIRGLSLRMGYGTSWASES